MKRKRLGNNGELIASVYLEKRGFKIIVTNYYSQYGEIDIIAKKNQQLHFIEVKTRKNLKGVILGDLLTDKQKESLYKTIAEYLSSLSKIDVSYQLDLLVVLYDQMSKKAKVSFYEAV